MSDKERPPVIRKDSKSLYIIDGSKKKRIYHNANKQSQTVNLILDSCVTNEKRKRKKRPASMRTKPTIKQLADNPNSQMYHLLRDKQAELQRERQINATKQAVDAITANPTDNSLAAIERNGTVQTVADQILGAPSEPIRTTGNVSGMSRLVPNNIPPSARVSARDDGEPLRAPPNTDEKYSDPPVMDKPELADTGSVLPNYYYDDLVGEVDPPKQQSEPMQLMEQTDIEVNAANEPIVPGEASIPNVADQPEEPEEPEVKVAQPSVQEAVAPFTPQRVVKITKYPAGINASTPVDKLITSPIRLFLSKGTVEVIKPIAEKYGFKTEGRKTIGIKPDSKPNLIDYLSNDSTFLITARKYYDELKSDPNLKADELREAMWLMFQNSKVPKYGSGRTKMLGLYNDQIDDQLDHLNCYAGCISRDEIGKLQLNDCGKYAIVYNTVPSGKPTTYDGHWRAIFIDLDGDKSIDHYDSFGMEAEPDIQEQVASLLKSFDLPYYLKWKDNRIVNQRANSSNCGWFCIQFLTDRAEGKPFIDATGYSAVDKSEKALKKRFGYLM